MAFDVREILEAYATRRKPTEEQKQLAEARLKVCETCSFRKEFLKVARCSKCGCVLGAKVFTSRKGACPVGFWDEVDKVEKNKQHKTVVSVQKLQKTAPVSIRAKSLI